MCSWEMKGCGELYENDRKTWGAGESVRVPVLDNCRCRVNNSTIHIPKETRKGDLLRRLAVVRLRTHDEGCAEKKKRNTPFCSLRVVVM